MLASMVEAMSPIGASFCSVRSVNAVIIVIMEACAVGFLVSFRTDDRFGVVGSVVSLLLALVVGIRLLFAHEKCLASARLCSRFSPY